MTSYKSKDSIWVRTRSGNQTTRASSFNAALLLAIRPALLTALHVLQTTAAIALVHSAKVYPMKIVLIENSIVFPSQRLLHRHQSIESHLLCRLCPRRIRASLGRAGLIQRSLQTNASSYYYECFNQIFFFSGEQKRSYYVELVRLIQHCNHCRQSRVSIINTTAFLSIKKVVELRKSHLR